MKMKHPQLVAYGVLVLAMVAGFLQVHSLGEDLAREVKLRQLATCNSYNQLENILDTIVTEVTTDRSPVPEDLPPEVQRLLEQSRRDSERFRDRVTRLLNEAECPVRVPGDEEVEN